MYVEACRTGVPTLQSMRRLRHLWGTRNKYQTNWCVLRTTRAPVCDDSDLRSVRLTRKHKIVPISKKIPWRRTQDSEIVCTTSKRNETANCCGHLRGGPKYSGGAYDKPRSTVCFFPPYTGNHSLYAQPYIPPQVRSLRTLAAGTPIPCKIIELKSVGTRLFPAPLCQDSDLCQDPPRHGMRRLRVCWGERHPQDKISNSDRRELGEEANKNHRPARVIRMLCTDHDPH